MARQAINVGLPNPNFIVETGTRQAILPGVFQAETVTDAAAIVPLRRCNLLLEPEPDPDWLPQGRRPPAPPPPPPPQTGLPWKRAEQFWAPIAEPELEPDWLPRRQLLPASPPPPPAAALPWRIGGMFWNAIAEPELEPDWLPRRRLTMPAQLQEAMPWKRAGQFWYAIADPELDPDWLPRRQVAIGPIPPPPLPPESWVRGQRFWEPIAEPELEPDWLPHRRQTVTPAPGAASAAKAVEHRTWHQALDSDELEPWYPRRRSAGGLVRPIPFRRVGRQDLVDDDDPDAWNPIRRRLPMGQITQAGGRITEQQSLRTVVASSLAPRPLGAPDPLWVAVEFDLWDSVAPQNPDNTTTLRLSNRGPLTRNVGGVLYQYEPRLIVPLLLGQTLTVFSGGGGLSNDAISMFQQPLRGQPNGGKISWALDPDFAPLDDLLFSGYGSAGWLDTGRFRWLGRTFRVYEGRTTTDVGVDVDGSGLTLVYTGHISGISYDLAASGGPSATVQTTDAQSGLDKTLVDDLYPTDFVISSLQGKTKPELRGRALSIEPVLEDAANLIYRVTRTEPGVIELDDVTELRVGGVAWEKVTGGASFVPNTTPTIANLLAQYSVLNAADQAGYNSVVGNDPASYNNGPGLQNKLYLVALYTAFERLTAPQRTQYNNTVGSNPAAYNNTPPGVQSKLNLASSFFPSSPTQGQWAVDTAAGTIKLGSVTDGAEIRCDAQSVGFETLDTAQLIAAICTEKGVPVDPAYMAQLRLDWPGLTSYFTPAAEGKNTLDALDEITLGNLCWWSFGPDGSVIAGFVDEPDPFLSDFVLFGSNPQAPFDINLLPPETSTIDPVPKELASNSLSQLLPPAWRARLGYARRWSPGSQFLGGITDQEQSFWRAPELVEDWTGAAAQAGWSLAPADGVAIRLMDPRAQDLYLSTLAWREDEAFTLRLHLVQRITNAGERLIFDATAWLPAAQIKLFQTVTVLWVDDNARTQIIYGGTYRVTSAIRSIGGGPQQLELWGSGDASAINRLSATSAPPVAVHQVPAGLAFTVFPMSIGTIAGTVVAIVNVATSNGQPFLGTVGFAPPFDNDGGTVEINFVTPSNVNVVLARDLTQLDAGFHNVTVGVSQNGTTVSSTFTYAVYPLPPSGSGSGGGSGGGGGGGGGGDGTGIPTLSAIVTPAAPTISSATPLGAIVATLQGVWSDGSPFTGYFQFAAPNFNDNGVYAISGNTLIINPTGPGVSVAGGSIEHVTIVPVQ